MRKSAVDVRTLLAAAADSMWATFKASAASTRPDHKGGPREQQVRQFLKERLPPKWGVTRGHVFFAGDATSQEFDVIVYDALNCPSWTLDGSDDPRRLVPLEAVIGVIEVKSTLDDRTLRAAIDKIFEFDSIVENEDLDSSYRPFRYLFAYRLDRDADFDGWGGPNRMLTRYAGARAQPDGMFMLDSEFSVLTARHDIARSFALHRGETVDEVLAKSWDVQNEEIRRDIELDPSYCHDYFTTRANDGLLLLSFLTFVLESASSYRVPEIDYADIFCRWGGPMLGGLLHFHEPSDLDLLSVPIRE
ncbi:hypothetical protein GN109_12635 [Collimonas pratensis]|uniref:DUF6602 domain-containing protein n=1 Tax=Collimonas pratensis TaxID=279113 RepID=UPI00143D79D6|nr:DUF6602 domain-containing protein [Collimonas pratensis]NKI70266.1 hypothetical protein [Collimonas pratensis]